MKKFNEFIVRKQTPNKERALSLIEEASLKKQFLEVSLDSIPSDKMNANFIVDQCYDILMELIRAKMFLEGYNAGNSHEAEVAYLQVLGFIDSDVRFMDEMRYYRNGTKYYGKILDMDFAKKVLDFMHKMHGKLKKVLK